MTEQTAIVIGGGIIGLSIAFHLANDFQVTVLDRDHAGDKASYGNAAGMAVTEVMPVSVPGLAWKVPGWLLDPLGPLAVRPRHAVKLLPWLWRFSKAGKPSEVERIAVALAALNSRVYADLIPMLDASGLASQLQQKGALTVYESEHGPTRDAVEWDLKRRHGFEAVLMSGQAARDMEPSLGPLVKSAVFTPAWSHVRDPKALTETLKEWLVRERGVIMLPGNATALQSGSRPAIICEDGRRIEADRIVVAAGAWSGRLTKTIGDLVSIESERGYNTTLHSPGIQLTRELIFADRKFVATPLSIGLRIGGAAEFGGLESEANFKRSDALLTLAKRYFPALQTAGGTRWAGHRPTTPDSLPIIGRASRDKNIIYAFGHGHLGLTQAATTGRLVADVAAGRPDSIDLSPYSAARFA
ncbi:glycine/D-amino acid oxidase-like deaminating enzyme [Bosea sp. AK1]|uniref:NAD(P)/FAD-dependent oxidoreductase n=1 Tax=Bosea sp. AK1 TaxID=2587160 RepID=UPI0011527C41|nr:FAD-binding oxidoreductase [Bosea sp. AK1]TQI65275.1 glycine/D-amino acid oxidase-like deaminating enzyme [Bosea sp. AK1]